MKKFIIKSIKIHNFKGIADANINFDKDKTVLIAPNFSGKSSIMKAFEWCFSQQVNDFIPKLNNQELIGITTKVEVCMQIDNCDYAFTRESVGKYDFNEKTNDYTRKTSNTNTYYIDGIEFAQTDYNKYLLELFGIETLDQLPMFIDKNFFSVGNLKFDWRARRKLLVNISGADIATKSLRENEEFAVLKPYLDKKFDINSIKQMLEHDKKVCKSQQERNLILIEQKELEQISLKSVQFDELEKELESLGNELHTLRDKTQNEYDTDKIQELGKQIVATTTELEKLRTQDELKLSDMKKQLTELYSKAIAIKADIDKARVDLEEQKRTQIEIKNHKVDDQCPTCKQQLPPEQIEQHQQQIKAKLKAINANIKDTENKIKENISKYNEMKANYNTMTAEIAEFEANPQIKVLADLLKTQKQALDGEKNASNVEFYKKQEQIILDKIKYTTIQLSKREQLAENNKLIEQWRNENMEFADRILDFDNQLAVLDKYVRTENQIVCDKVNEMFPKEVTFTLFKENYNGSIDYECTPMYNKVRYESLSTGEKIRLNLAIQETLQNAFGLNFPIFIDDYESLTTPIESDRQLICLKADEETKRNFDLLTIKNKKGEK